MPAATVLQRRMAWISVRQSRERSRATGSAPETARSPHWQLPHGADEAALCCRRDLVHQLEVPHRKLHGGLSFIAAPPHYASSGQSNQIVHAFSGGRGVFRL